MDAMVILERTNNHFSRLIELLQSRPEIRIKDIKKVVAHSSYYAIIIKKIYGLNQILREINPDLYFAEPSFTITTTKDIFTSLTRCKFIEIETRENFFIIRHKK